MINSIKIVLFLILVGILLSGCTTYYNALSAGSAESNEHITSNTRV